MPEDDVKVPEEEPVKRPKTVHPAETTAKLQGVAESIVKIGSNLGELTSALDNLVRVSEKVTGKSRE